MCIPDRNEDAAEHEVGNTKLMKLMLNQFLAQKAMPTALTTGGKRVEL